MDLAEIRRQITDPVENGAVGMVEATMDEVGKGHYLGIEIPLRDDRTRSGDIPGRCPRGGFAGRNPVANAGYS